jgi:hypothetical protein
MCQTKIMIIKQKYFNIRLAWKTLHGFYSKDGLKKSAFQ